uniref:Uncharacterized protein n=1 Tax=Xiphophorus couchianus TaxID=32473 RepID=A0A3B5LUU7_9TELE
MELAKCKIDIMSLNSQLLDSIQQKLNLSQQLEAWQVGQRGQEANKGAAFFKIENRNFVYVVQLNLFRQLF